MDGETEIINFVKIVIVAITSLCYCYHVVARLRRGFTRLLTLLPIFYLFIALPLNLSSFHLTAATSFFIVWLANFKLLLFAFDSGPLISNPPLPLLHFISFALLPITLAPKHGPLSKVLIRPTLLALRFFFLAIIVHLYNYRPYLHPSFISALYCFHIFHGIELVLVLSGIWAQVILGLEIESQFNKPYLATSLEDYWGRRWNIHASNILRLTVYNRTLQGGTHILGRMWGRPLAIFITFLVSGLMHEVIIFYMARVAPTWEATCFLVVHGLCTATEVVVKPAVCGRYRPLNRIVSRLLTIGFVGVTFVGVLLPQMIKNGLDFKLVNEYSVTYLFSPIK